MGSILTGRPLARDALFYIISLGLCVLFALTSVSDNNPDLNGKAGFEWWEGLILILCYFVYVHAMIKNDVLMNFLAKHFGHNAHIKEYLKFSGGLDSTLQDGVPTWAKKDAAMTRKPSKMFLVDPVFGVKPNRLAFAKASVRHLADVGKAAATVPEASNTEPEDAQESNRSITELWEGAAIEDVEMEQVHPAVALLRDLEEQAANGAKQDELSMRIGKELVELQVEVDTLRQDLRPLFKSSAKDFLAYEGDDEDSFLSRLLNIASLPFTIAFKLTIPSCDRNSFQTWANAESSNMWTWMELPQSAKDRMVAGLENGIDADGDIAAAKSAKYVVGKYPRDQVDVWYAKSSRYWVSFAMSVVWIWLTSWLMVFFSERVGMPP